MKNILFAFTLCVMTSVYADASFHRITVQHEPASATVYQSGALVTRTADVQLKKGRNIIVFANIPDNINTGTIRMAERSAALPCSIRSISWERATSTLYRNDELRKLTAAKNELEQKIRQKKDTVEVQTKTLALLDQYRTLHADAVSEQGHTSGKNDKSWKSSRDALLKRYQRVLQEKRNTESGIKDLQQELKQIEAKLRSCSEGVTARRISVLVTADAPAASKATLQITYLTHAASWTPRYQAKVISGSNTLDLEYSGAVKQKTGEPWNNIELILSTAPVRISATPPKIKSWVLFGAPQQKGKSARKIVTVESADCAMPMLAAAGAPVTNDMVKVSKKGDAASVTYTLPGKYTIADGDQESSFVITRRTFKTDYRIEAIPELRKNAFICAEFHNDSPFLLLPGAVAISRDSGYIGTSELPLTAQGGKNKLYAGAVDGVSMSSKRIQNYRKTEGVVNKEECTYETWCSTLINTSNKSITLDLKQRIPVSEVEEVKITLQRQTTRGYHLDAKTGFITWKLTLKPGELKKINLAYRTAKKL